MEVLAQVASGLLARGAVERHVEGDQPRALGVAALLDGLGLVEPVGVAAIAGDALKLGALGRRRRLGGRLLRRGLGREALGELGLLQLVGLRLVPVGGTAVERSRLVEAGR